MSSSSKLFLWQILLTWRQNTFGRDKKAREKKSPTGHLFSALKCRISPQRLGRQRPLQWALRDRHHHPPRWRAIISFRREPRPSATSRRPTTRPPCRSPTATPTTTTTSTPHQRRSRRTRTTSRHGRRLIFRHRPRTGIRRHRLGARLRQQPTTGRSITITPCRPRDPAPSTRLWPWESAETLCSPPPAFRQPWLRPVTPIPCRTDTAPTAPLVSLLSKYFDLQTCKLNIKY